MGRITSLNEQLGREQETANWMPYLLQRSQVSPLLCHSGITYTSGQWRFWETEQDIALLRLVLTLQQLFKTKMISGNVIFRLNPSSVSSFAILPNTIRPFFYRE